MTLRDECQGNQHAEEVALFASSAALRDHAKGEAHEVREEKKKNARKEEATEQADLPFHLYWTPTACISSEQMLLEQIF